MRVKIIFSLVCLLMMNAQAQTPSDKPKDVLQEVQEISISARAIKSFSPVAPSKLEWVGGLDLSSTAKGFGGFSGLAVSGDGANILAVSDGGIWVSFKLETMNGTPISVKNAMLAPLRDQNGHFLAGSPKGDAESLALRNGQAIIGFEQTDAIWRYDYGKQGLDAKAQTFSFPQDIKKLRYSRGLESLAVFPENSRYAGALLAVGESPVRGEDNLRAWIIEGKEFRRLTVLVRNNFEVTDAAFRNNGNLLLLERRFIPPFNVACRIREIKGEQISSGARLDGEIIFEASLNSPIDNMEGMSLHKGTDGAEYVTLISDNNYNVFQRTLLLRFKFAAIP